MEHRGHATNASDGRRAGAGPADSDSTTTAVRGDTERPNGPRSRKGALTRARLVEAAKAVFEENGFQEARISEITERAGWSYGSFYHYFNSKEEIFREIAGAQEDGLDMRVIVKGEPVDDAIDGLVTDRLAPALHRYLADYRDEARIMGVIEEVSRYDRQVGAMRVERLERFSGELSDAIGRLQRHGMADPGLDPGVAARALMAMVTRFAETWFVQHQLDCSFDAGVAQLGKLCANALRLGPRPQRDAGRALG
jgi:AcrR family transcriptional regulator